MQLLELATELLCAILALVDEPVALVNAMVTCRRLHSLFDTESVVGRRLWRVIRCNMGWPDPTLIGLSDHEFIRAIYGRGCERCSAHPRVRTPLWEFKGLRLCGECRERLTTRDYELEIPAAWCDHLPSVLTQGYTWGRGQWEYRSFWTADLPSAEPSREEREAGRAILSRLRNFRASVEAHQAMLRERKECKDREKRDARFRAVEAFLVEKLPDLHPHCYADFDAYNVATYKTTKFTKSAQTVFHRKILSELATRKVSPRQAEFHAGRLCEAHGVHFRCLKALPAYAQAIEQVCRESLLPTPQKVATALADLLPLARLEMQKEETRIRWLEAYATSKVSRHQLKKSTLFQEADPLKEKEFAEFAESLQLPKPVASTSATRDQATGDRPFYCTRCGFCRRIGATSARIEAHFAESARCTEEEDLGRLRES
jgi:hypothetical protein